MSLDSGQSKVLEAARLSDAEESAARGVTISRYTKAAKSLIAALAAAEELARVLEAERDYWKRQACSSCGRGGFPCDECIADARAAIEAAIEGSGRSGRGRGRAPGDVCEVLDSGAEEDGL